MNQRGFPRKILFKEALKCRLPAKHRKRSIIEIEIAQDRAGFKGEKMVDFHLRSLPKDNYRIFNDLRLDDGNPFQIDNLLLNHSFFLIIDSKNIDGTTTVETQFNQSIQESFGKKRRLKNPIAQIKRSHFLLMEWLEQHHFYSIPIEVLIVNTNPVGIIKTDDPLLALKVLNAENLPQRIEEFQKKYTRSIFTSSELSKIYNFLVEENSPAIFDAFEMYGIKKDEIQNGVPCPKCGKLTMERKKRCWYCCFCDVKSPTAHIPAIRHYFLLIKPFITVSECCDWLCLPSPDIARRLLQSMDLPYTGVNKGRVYFDPWYVKNHKNTIFKKY